MKAFLTILALSAGLAAGPAGAQTAPPDAATLTLAREVVQKAGGDRATVLDALTAPMTTLVQQMGVSDAGQAQALVSEVVIPTLSTHYDALLDVQARSYAATLSAADLKAVSAFYGTPAGRNLAAAQPKLAQAQLTGLSQWMTGIMPDLQTKLTAALKARAAQPAAKPRP